MVYIQYIHFKWYSLFLLFLIFFLIIILKKESHPQSALCSHRVLKASRFLGLTRLCAGLLSSAGSTAAALTLYSTSNRDTKLAKSCMLTRRLGEQKKKRKSEREREAETEFTNAKLVFRLVRVSRSRKMPWSSAEVSWAWDSGGCVLYTLGSCWRRAWCITGGGLGE